MGIRNGVFYKPTAWVNDSAPAIDAAALSATETFAETIKHENLLLNWDFTKAIPASNTQVYAAKFWETKGSTTATIGSDGLSFSGVVQQTINRGITRGINYTVSVITSTGIFGASVKIPDTGVGEVTFDFGKITLGYSSTSGKWVLIIEATTQVTIKKIKLETGIYSTLTQDDSCDAAILADAYANLDDAGNYVQPATTRTFTIGVAAWTGTASPFTCDITIDGLTDADIVLVKAPDEFYTENNLSYTQNGNVIKLSVDFKPTNDAEIGIGIIKAREVV